MAISNGSAVDVLVVGAGIFGLSVAWAARQRGLSVRVLEARSVAAGASGGVVGALSPHVPDQWNPKKQFQLNALLAAAAHWRAVDAASGIDSCYRRRGRLMPLASGEARALAQARTEGAAAHWRGAAQWQVLPAASDPAWLGPTPFGAVHETLSAQIHPARACASLAAALRKDSVEIIENTAVRAATGNQVTTAAGVQAAGAVVLAAGVEGFGLMPVPGAAGSGSGVKGQAAWLTPASDLAPLLERAPVIFADGTYIVAHPDGVAVGSTSERVYADPATTDTQLDAVIARARALCPALATAPVAARWAGVRPKARKRDPMLGPVPGQPGLFVANGAFKIGFGIAHAVGSLVADMIEGRPVDIPDSFSVGHHLPTT